MTLRERGLVVNRGARFTRESRVIPPTGKHATWRATLFRRVRDGKVVQGHATFDWLSFLQQIGAVVTLSVAQGGTEERPASR